MKAILGEQTCSVCGVIGGSETFSPNKTKKNGLASRCRPCSNEATMTSRRRTPESWEAHKKAVAECLPCNAKLGHIEDPDWLEAAFGYLGKDI